VARDFGPVPDRIHVIRLGFHVGFVGLRLVGFRLQLRSLPDLRVVQHRLYLRDLRRKRGLLRRHELDR